MKRLEILSFLPARDHSRGVGTVLSVYVPEEDLVKVRVDWLGMNSFYEDPVNCLSFSVEGQDIEGFHARLVNNMIREVGEYGSLVHLKKRG